MKEYRIMEILLLTRKHWAEDGKQEIYLEGHYICMVYVFLLAKFNFLHVLCNVEKIWL